MTIRDGWWVQLLKHAVAPGLAIVIGLKITRQIIKCSVYTTSGKGYFSCDQSHFHAGQGSGQHQIIKITQMADSENPALYFGEPGTERHVKSLENDLT